MRLVNCFKPPIDEEKLFLQIGALRAGIRQLINIIFSNINTQEKITNYNYLEEGIIRIRKKIVQYIKEFIPSKKKEELKNIQKNIKENEKEFIKNNGPDYSYSQNPVILSALQNQINSFFYTITENKPGYEGRDQRKQSY